MEEVYFCYVDSPIGRLMLVGNGGGLKRIEFEKSKTTLGPQPGWRESAIELEPAARQLREYFSGARRSFDLPLAAEGTEFQRRTWDALCQIPYGATVSYADLARSIGKPKAVRAVGAANGRNPLPIVVPCHRVVGSDGSLTGFAAGTAIKKRLLQLEGAQVLVEAQRFHVSVGNPTQGH